MIDIKLTTANGRDTANISNFTKGQLVAYNELIKFINAPYDENDYKRALVGPAGTGKTYLIKSVLKNCSMSYGIIGLSAPTHKACRVLRESIGNIACKVITLQSALGFRPNYDFDNFDINNIEFSALGKIKIAKYKLFIIDEASMIPDKSKSNKGGLRTFLERVCKKNECKIIYIGDDHQLPPVNEKHSTAFLNVKLYRLTEIVRQDEDNPISPLLAILRDDIDHKSFKFLEYISKHKEQFDIDNTKGYKVCNQAEFNQLVYNNFNDERITKDIDFARVISYKNINVSYWNNVVRNAIIKDANKGILTKNDLVLSYITIVDNFMDPIILNSEEYIIRDIVNYTHPTYGLKGYMVTFAAIHGGKQTNPLFVVDHADAYSINAYVKLSDQLVSEAKTAPQRIRSQKWKQYFAFKEGCLLLCNIAKANGSILYNRNLDYGFAITAHKAQGSTYDTVLVDVNDIVFDKHGTVYTDAEEINRRLYTAISRCKSKAFLRFGA